MNATKYLATFAVLMLTAIAALAPVSAQALPMEIDRVEIDDIELDADTATRLSLQRGQTYEFEVALTALADANDVELEAFISGFEYNDVARIGDIVGPFDIDTGNRYIKRLQIRIPDDVDEDDYKLRLIASSRNSDTFTQTYNLKLDVPRHEVQIEDVVWYPQAAEAGKAVLATVRVENKGEKIEDDVKVVASIPELGVQAVEYIEEIEEDDEEETEELFLKIPTTAESGTYSLVVEVFYDELYRKVEQVTQIDVRGSLTQAERENTPKNTISVSTPEAQASSNGAATYTLTVTNHERTAKLYSLTVQDNNWADVSISPRAAEIVRGGESQIFTIQAMPLPGVEGSQVLTLTVSEGAQVLQKIPLTANIQQVEASTSGAMPVLAGLLVLFIVIAILLGAFLANKNANEDADINAEAYY